MKSLRFVSAPHIFSSHLVPLISRKTTEEGKKKLIYDGKKFSFSQTIDDLHEKNSW